MAQSFLDQYKARDGAYANAPAPTATKPAEQPGILERAAEAVGLKKSATPALTVPKTPGQNYAPSLYQQAAGKNPAPASFLEQYQTRTGNYAGAKQSGSIPTTGEEGKIASMSSFLDEAPQISRIVGKEAKSMLDTGAAAMPNLPKPRITPDLQAELDQPDQARKYVQSVKDQQPPSLVKMLAKAFSDYNTSVYGVDRGVRTAENLAIGAGATLESFLGAVQWLAPKKGPISSKIGEDAGSAADHLGEWLAKANEAQGDQNFADQLAQGVGSSAIFFLPGMGVARAGTMLATVSPRLALLFGSSVSAALESMSEAGNVYRSVIADKNNYLKSHTDTRLTPETMDKDASDAATKTFWANVILISLTNRFGVFNPDTAGFVRRMVMSAPIEGVQEAAQQIIQNFTQSHAGEGSQPRDLLDGAGQSFLIGAIVGGIMGAGVESMMGETTSLEGDQNVLKVPGGGGAPDQTVQEGSQASQEPAGATETAKPAEVSPTPEAAPQEAAQTAAPQTLEPGDTVTITDKKTGETAQREVVSSREGGGYLLKEANGKAGIPRVYDPALWDISLDKKGTVSSKYKVGDTFIDNEGTKLTIAKVGNNGEYFVKPEGDVMSFPARETSLDQYARGEEMPRGEKLLEGTSAGYMSDKQDLRDEGFTGIGATFGPADVVRTADGKPVMAFSWHEGDLAGFEVHPTFQGKGVGQAFLHRVLNNGPVGVIDPNEKMLSLMRKVGNVTGPDGRGVYTLSAKDAEMDMSDPAQIADSYFKDVIEPKIGSGETITVAGDDMKAHFGNDYDPARSDIYAKAAYQIMQKLIADPRIDDFVFMGGGPGSGKSEFVGKMIVQNHAADVLYDTTLSSVEGTRTLVELSKTHKKGLQISSILANLERARDFTHVRARETGRSVTPEAFARGHAGFIETLKTLLADKTLDPKQVNLYDLRDISTAEEARAAVENETALAADPVAVLEKISYTADYVQGIASKEGPSSPLDQGGGSDTRGVPAEDRAAQKPAEVLELKPEDLKKNVSVMLEQMREQGHNVTPGVEANAAKFAKQKVKIGNEYVPRPDQVVTKAALKDLLAASRTDSIDFTVEKTDRETYLVARQGDTLMKLKASALGLLTHKLEAGAIVRMSSAALKEKGTALRVHGSGGALAFNIKNLAAGVASEAFTQETDKIVKRSEIAENLARELGVPVRTGKFKEKALGIFKPWAHVIRLRGKLGNMRIPVLVHESAHYLDYTMLGQPTKTKKGKSWISTKFVSDMIPRSELDPLLQEYGGQPKSKKREAFAEFVRYWVTEPQKAQTRAPEFSKIWEEQILPDFPEVRDTLLTTKADFERWNSMPAVAKIVSQISFGEKTTLEDAKDAIVKTWHDTITGWIDDLHPIKKFSDLMKENGAAFDMTEDPYVLARLSRGWVGKASTFLEKGTFGVRFWRMHDGTAEPAFTGKGFVEIMKPIADKHAAEDFAAYLVSRRAIALNAREIHSGFDTKTAQEAMDALAQKHPEFADAAKELDQYQDALLDYAHQSGLIRTEGLKAMKETLRDYVPFYRVMEAGDRKGFGGKTFADIASPIKRIKGSDRDVINPLESIVKNTYAIMNAAERNRVGLAMVNLSKKHPAGMQIFEKVPEDQAKVASVKVNDLIEQVSSILDYRGPMAQKVLGDLGEQVVNIFRPSFMHGDNIVTVMVGGKPQSFYTESDIYRAMQGMDVEDVGFVWKMLSYPSRWLRAGATLTPEFMVRNPSRDMLSAYVYSEYGFMPPVDAARGLFGALTKDNAYWLWRMGGGEHSMLVSMDRTTLKKTYQELSEEHNLTTLPGVINVAKRHANPLENLRLFSEFSEKMTRIGEAKKALSRGANPIEAAFTAREVTLDFAKMGSKARAVNMIIAFFNAQVQGSVRMVRAFKEHPYRTTTKTMIGITLPSVLLALWNSQEPDWPEIPQWQKDLFWLVKIGDTWVRFPKPFELGILFGSVPERVIESIQYDDPNVWPELRKAMLDGASPSLLPTALAPIIENTTNYSFFLDRNLVPDSAEGLPPFAQYTAYTSDTAKHIGKWLDYSPAKIDNLISGYFGGLGRYATQMIDKFSREITGKKEAVVAPAATPADVPVVKAFVIRDPVSSSSESLNRFYVKAEQALAAKSYYDDLLKKGDSKTAGQWYADHVAEISLSSYYETTRRNLATLRRLQSMARDSKDLTAEQKRSRMDELGRLMTDIAQKAIEVKLANP